MDERLAFEEARPSEVRPHGHRLPDKKFRRLDCAVLNFYFKALEEEGIKYDSVRCAFIEGEPAFEGSGIYGETHIQVAVRSPACILGVFRPMMDGR